LNEDRYVFDDARKSSGAFSAVVTGIASAIAAVTLSAVFAPTSQATENVQQANAPSQPAADASQSPSEIAVAPTSARQPAQKSGSATEILYYNKSGVAQPKQVSKPKKTAASEPKSTPIGNVTAPTWNSAASGNTSGPTASGSGNKTSPTAALGNKREHDGGHD